MAKCYILASISTVLQHQMQDVEPASDIMLSPKEMFGEQDRSARQDTIRILLNTKMVQGTPIREHCLKMISYLNTLEVLGADIDRESQVDMILQSLPESFKEFRLNYNMNKKIYIFSELMNELVVVEGILVKPMLILIWLKHLLLSLSRKARVVGRRRTSPNKKVNKLP